ncbi:MAG: HD domain-containing protein [Treponema sp.]|uniref:HD-GYP domain-containing protein n=1 Tax=Treponema sp. TaxID=166 RepID=UPI001B59B8D7|nr:HD domain-containing phosphohydrolase [Treponema sp.]MBP5402000.1 HD domain-containing protein [Treponema sp.]MBR5933338.1 HD domain-containing protein [Treponema sp.]
MIRRDFYLPQQRPFIVSLFTSLFALTYHICFLFVFLSLGIYQMFYFNIGSILVFSVSTFLLVKRKPFTPLYIITTFEVILHQIFAEYYLGADTSFHFFMLIMGFLPFLIFTKKRSIAFIFCFLSLVLFCLLEIFSKTIQPVYEISDSTVFVIRTINIFLAIIVLCVMISLFSHIVQNVEFNLEHEVMLQAEKLQTQNERIIKYQKNTILSLSNLVENRDSDTGEHVRRTSTYVYLLAKAARANGYYKDLLSERYIDLLYRAAPMHDIGKIVVSDLILKKPGKLTFEEYEQIKTHTTAGEKIIHDILDSSEDSDYITLAAEIAVAHHEHWDGTGYPKKLKADEIPLSARIMAIADVFDALVTQRCYKKAFSIEDAFEIIRESSGTHFDPTLTKIFLENRRAIINILTQYQD